MSSHKLKVRNLLSLCVALVLILPWGITVFAESTHQKQFVYDYAELLTAGEVAELESLSSELSAERETAFIIITVNGTEGKDIVPYVDDFYEEHALGYNEPHGNAAILSIDLQERDVFLAGFEKAEHYLDDQRMEQIRTKITPNLSEAKYFEAFSAFISTSYEYMGYEPGVNPENILFKWWFQIGCSIIVASVIVALMAYRSGGRVTVNARTYMDTSNSSVINKYDRYIRKNVTKRKKPSNNNKSGGGGVRIPGGGRSRSGSRGKF